MKHAWQQKNAAPASEEGPAVKQSFFKAEWPLFLYPALVVAALVVLYGVHRSMQREPAPSKRPPVRTSQETQTTDVEDIDRETAAPKIEPTAGVPRLGRDRDRTRVVPALGPGQPQETAGLLATLGHALKAEDHATIKQCMRDIVALGDDAVETLGELITQGDSDTALWAAEALARIGTPSAAGMLLNTLEQVEEGPYKEQLAKQMATINNHESWPVLMDAFLESADATIQRAASTSLAGMADTAIVDEIVALYDAATTEEQMTQLASLISNINSPKASASLLALAGDIASAPQDALQAATIEALAHIGDPQCVSYLFQKLEAASPGEGSYLYTAITGIDQPEAQSALLYAAAGNKEVSAEQGRTAAICALGNYPNTDTYALLQQIAASEDNTAVVTAAVRTIERMERSTPTLAETTTSKADPAVTLPTNPLQK